MKTSILVAIMGLGFLVMYIIGGVDYEIMELNLFWWGMFTLLFYFFLTLQEDIEELKNMKKT